MTKEDQIRAAKGGMHMMKRSPDGSLRTTVKDLPEIAPIDMAIQRQSLEKFAFQQLVENLEYAIDQLPPQLRDLTYGQLEKSVRALAEETQIPKSTVADLLTEAKVRLKDTLNQ